MSITWCWRVDVLTCWSHNQPNIYKTLKFSKLSVIVPSQSPRWSQRCDCHMRFLCMESQSTLQGRLWLHTWKPHQGGKREFLTSQFSCANTFIAQLVKFWSRSRSIHGLTAWSWGLKGVDLTVSSDVADIFILQWMQANLWGANIQPVVCSFTVWEGHLILIMLTYISAF